MNDENGFKTVQKSRNKPIPRIKPVPIVAWPDWPCVGIKLILYALDFSGEGLGIDMASKTGFKV